MPVKKAEVYEIRPSRHAIEVWEELTRDLQKFGWLAARRRECYSAQLRGYLVEAKRISTAIQEAAMMTISRCAKPVPGKGIKRMRREDILIWPLDDSRVPF